MFWPLRFKECSNVGSSAPHRSLYITVLPNGFTASEVLTFHIRVAELQERVLDNLESRIEIAFNSRKSVLSTCNQGIEKLLRAVKSAVIFDVFKK